MSPKEREMINPRNQDNWPKMKKNWFWIWETILSSPRKSKQSVEDWHISCNKDFLGVVKDSNNQFKKVTKIEFLVIGCQTMWIYGLAWSMELHLFTQKKACFSLRKNYNKLQQKVEFFTWESMIPSIQDFLPEWLK